MTLSRGDDFPVHQTPDPIAFAGSDRNFYDRYFFNGYGLDGDDFFALAFGVYPQLNIADASFCVVRNGVETALHASKWLAMERMDLAIGPIRIEVVEPLHRLKLCVDAPAQGLKVEILFTGRAFPIQEPRFSRRHGPQVIFDYTRLTQNGRYEGWLELDGVRTSVDGFVGVRDRSWGIRPVGAREPQATPPVSPPQFYWIWSPINFPDGSLFFHTQDDAAGAPWNRRAVWAPDGAAAAEHRHIDDCAIAIDWKPDARHARRAVIRYADQGSAGEVILEPRFEFFMLGLGYGHPKWGHGMAHDALSVEREDIDLARIDRRAAQHLHVQAVSKATWRDSAGREQVGRGALEQLVIGPHAPSGFTDLLGLPTRV